MGFSTPSATKVRKIYRSVIFDNENYYYYCCYYCYQGLTRQLSYRKDEGAMRPMYGCPNFWESLTPPTATFPEIFNNRLLFQLSL